MLVRCAWCGKAQGEKLPLNDPHETSTLCRDCYRQKFPCQWVRQARRELGLSQPRLAELLGVHWGTLAHWEQGLRTPGEPVLKLLDRLIAESEGKIEEGI